MNLQAILYFSSIVLTCLLTGFLAWYAWKHRQVPGSSAYMWLALSECLLALTEILSVLSPSMASALFWFQVRYPIGASIAVFWLVFALEYSGHREWISKRLLAGIFVIPLVTQILFWSNSLHGLWMKQEAAFYQIGRLWIVDISSRIPEIGYITHSFYNLFLTLAGIALMLLAAWSMRRELAGQALLLAGAGLTALFFVLNSLFDLLPKMEFNIFTPGIGLSVLLIALAVFRFEFLKHTPAQEKPKRLTGLAVQEQRSLAVFILIFILFASGIATASYVTYQNYQQQFRAQVDNQLAAIGSLKVGELQDWRNERLADASLFYKNENFSGQVQKYLENPQDADARIKMLTWMEKIKASPEYDRVFLLDTQGVDQISIPAAPEAVPAHLVEQSSASLALNKITFLDFHRHSENDAVHLSMLVPIFDPQHNQPLGVLVLRINPNVYLYPFIQRWPLPSQSAETLLIRQEGNDALYLNELRFRQDTALNLRIPLENENIPAVKAVLGLEGIMEGVDYRGVAVISDIRAVPDSPWFLVSKVDTAEVDAPLRERLWQTIVLFGVLILVSGTVLLLAWRQQQIRLYRGQIEAAEIVRESEEKLRKTLDFLPLGVSVLNADRKIVYKNPALSKILDMADEGLAKDVFSMRSYLKADGTPMSADEFASMRAIREQKAIYNVETGVVKEDGNLIWTEVNAVPVPLPGWNVVIVTADITERKRAEETLRTSEEKFRLAFETSPDAITITRLKDGMFVSVNKGFEQISGYGPQETIGKTSMEINVWKDPEDRRKVIEELQAKGEVRNYETHFLSRSGEIYGALTASVFDINGVPHILSTIRDITELKQATETLRKSEANLSALIENTDGSIWAVDEQCKLIVGNEEFHRNVSAALGRRLEAGESVLLPSFPAEANSEWQGYYARSLQGERFNVETSTRFRSDPHYIEYRFSPIREDGGEIRGVTIYGRDITERKQAEEALRESEQRLQFVLQGSQLGYWDWNLETNEVKRNERWAEMLGYDLSDMEFTVKQWIDFVHPDDQAMAQQSIQDHIEGRTPLHRLEYRMRTKDGKYKWILDQAQVVGRDSNQRAIRMSGTHTDITERKLGEKELRFKDELLRMTSEMAKIGGWEFDTQTLEGTWTDEVARIHDLPPGDPTNVQLGVSFYMPDSRRKIELAIQEAIESAKPYDLELQMTSAKGIQKWVRTICMPIVENGKVIKLQGIFQDITERKQTEEAQKQSELLFRALFELSPDAVVLLDPHDPNISSPIVDCNAAACLMSGYDRDELIGQPIDIVNADPYTQAGQTAYLKKLRDSGNLKYEVFHRRKNGVVFPVEVSTAMIKVGERELVIGIDRDITERKQAEESLRESEKHYRLISENSADVIWTLDLASQKFTYVSPSVFNLRGLTPAEVMAEPMQASMTPASFQEVSEDLPGRIAAFMSGDLSARIRTTRVDQTRKDGSIVPTEVVTNLITDANGRVVEVLGVTRDITERKQVEDALRESEAFVKIVIDNLPVGVAVNSVDPAVSFSYINDNFAKFYRTTKEKLADPDAFWSVVYEEPDFREEMKKSVLEGIASGNPERMLWVDIPITRKGETTTFVTARNIPLPGKPLMVSTVWDVTERKKIEEALQEYNTRLETEVEQRTRELREAQEQLVRQERLATLGQLAGSIGHELRNPLGVISNAVYFLKLSQPNASEIVREYLDIIEKETRTSDKIVTDLLDFTRIKSLNRQPASVSELIRQALERNPAPESVEAELEISADLPKINVDPQHIVQVFGNLISNAFQSMVPENGMTIGRKLTVSAVIENAMIKIDIQDMGVGIPPENMKKIFEPLFTTKIKGIGLGLAVSRKLTEANGGRIEVKSEVGKGSTFTVYLPINEESL